MRELIHIQQKVSIMEIRKKYLRSLTELYKLTEGTNHLLLVVPVSSIDSSLLQKLGFTNKIEAGQTILPASINKRTTENANGKATIRRDLPKEKYTVEWDITWEDWSGASHSKTVWFERERYVKEYSEAYSCNFYIVEIDSELYLTTDDVLKIDANEEYNIHICNLLLSCFGFFEIVDKDKKQIFKAERKELNWHILPPGEYPWARGSTFKNTITAKLSSQKRAKFNRRTKTLEELGPDMLAFGAGGFNHYFVYGFKSKNLFILESINENNATYVFEDSWEELSQLTKAEIIHGSLCKERIIHNINWEYNIRKLLAEAQPES